MSCDNLDQSSMGGNSHSNVIAWNRVCNILYLEGNGKRGEGNI